MSVPCQTDAVSARASSGNLFDSLHGDLVVPGVGHGLGVGLRRGFVRCWLSTVLCKVWKKRGDAQPKGPEEVAPAPHVTVPPTLQRTSVA